MSEPPTEDFAETVAPITVEPATDPDLPPEVAFVVPASAYESIATDEDLIASAESPAAPVEIPPPPAVPEPSAQAPAPAIDLSPALAAIEALKSRVEALGTAFDREIRAEATREKIVDRLHAELQEYKQGLVLSLLKPVFLDLIQLHDDVGKMVKTDEDGAGAPGSNRLADIQQGIEDILYRQGVEPFSADHDDFDARRQRAISTVPTEDPALARKVASRLRKGFAAGDKVIRPEHVSVYAARRP